MGKWGSGSQRVEIFSCKISKFWGSEVLHAAGSVSVYLKFTQREIIQCTHRWKCNLLHCNNYSVYESITWSLCTQYIYTIFVSYTLVRLGWKRELGGALLLWMVLSPGFTFHSWGILHTHVLYPLARDCPSGNLCWSTARECLRCPSWFQSGSLTEHQDSESSQSWGLRSELRRGHSAPSGSGPGPAVWPERGRGVSRGGPCLLCTWGLTRRGLRSEGKCGKVPCWSLCGSWLSWVPPETVATEDCLFHTVRAALCVSLGLRKGMCWL